MTWIDGGCHVNKFLGAQRKVVYCILVYLTWMERKNFPSCHVLIYGRMLQTSVNKVIMNIFFVIITSSDPYLQMTEELANDRAMLLML